MNLETINAVAAIRVVVSLFYLAAQIRQNTRSMRAMVIVSLAQSIANVVIRPMAEDRELMRAFHVVVKTGMGRLRRIECGRCPCSFGSSSFSRTHGYQQRQGALDPQHWKAWDAYIRMYYHRPGVKNLWRLRRAAFAAGFRDYIESSEPIHELPSVTQLIRGRKS